MSIDMVFPVAEGLNQGVFLDWYKRNEDSALAGRNVYIPTALQIAQASAAIEMVDKVLTVQNELNTVPLAAKVVIYLTPVAIAALSKMGIENDTLRSVVLFMQNQIGNLCHLVAVISSIALIQLGFVAYGAASLSFILLGFSCRTGIMPSCIRQTVNQLSNFLLIPLGAVCGSLQMQIYALIFAAFQCMKLYRYLTKVDPTAFVPRNNLDTDKLQEILASKKNLEINRDYVRLPTLVPAPEVNVRKVYESFDAIDWSRHIHALRGKLKDDRKYVEENGDPTNKSDEELMKHAKDTLHTFIESVLNHQILEGEPVDYGRMEHYLKIAVDAILKEEDEIARVDLLLRISVEGGKYCGPGKFEVAEDLYKSIVRKMDEIPFELKVLNVFQDMRDKLVRTGYGWFLEEIARSGGINAQMVEVVDFRDVHQYNTFVNMYAEDIGIRKAGADNDSIALVNELDRAMVGYITSGQIENIFWDYHTKDHIVEGLNENLGTPHLPKPEFYQWWIDWIQRQEISEAQKEALKEELANGQLFGKDIENRYGNVYEQFIQAMLFDLGILKESANTREQVLSEELFAQQLINQ